MLTIKVRRQDEAGEELREFAELPVTIGRHPDNDLVLAESTVSRKHARIELKDGRYRILDLGSAHGLYINKQRVQNEPLPEKCEIYLNPFVLEVNAPPPPSVDATAPPPEDGPAVAPPEEALNTLPTEPEPPRAPIELDIEDEPAADLPLLGDDEGGIIPVDDAEGGDALMEVGESGAVEVPGSTADDLAAVAAAAEEARADEAEVAEANTPDAAPDNIVGTIFEINMGPPKAPPTEAQSRDTAEVEQTPGTGEFQAEIEVDDGAPPTGAQASDMALAPATAAMPAGQQPQAIDEGTVLEYSAKDVHAYAEQVDAAAALEADAEGLPRHSDRKEAGAVPRTRAHVGGPAAGPAAKATPELESRADDLVAGREHGRLVALMLGLALVALTLIPTRGAPVPAFMGGAGIAPFAWVMIFAAGVAAIVASRLISNPVIRGAVMALAGLVPLVVLLATFDAQEVVSRLNLVELAEGRRPLTQQPGARLLLGWLEHTPVALWLLMAGAVLTAAAGRAARTWPEGLFARIAGPIGGLCCIALGLLAASADGPIPYAAVTKAGVGGYLLLAIPAAGAVAIALAAGKGRVLTFVPVALLAVGLCSPAVLHLQAPVPVYIDQARLMLLPVPLVFLAATGVAALAIAVMTRRRPDAQALLDRL